MAEQGTKNQGIEVWIGTKAVNPALDTFTQVKRVKSISEIGAEASVIDATTLEDAAKQKLKGIPDWGGVDFGGNRVYTDPGQDALAAAAADPDDDPYNVRVRVPGAGAAGANIQFSFKGLVNKFKDVPGQVDGLIEFASSVAISGAVTEGTYVVEEE